MIDTVCLLKVCCVKFSYTRGQNLKTWSKPSVNLYQGSLKKMLHTKLFL